MTSAVDYAARRDNIGDHLFLLATASLLRILPAACLRDPNRLATAIRAGTLDDHPDGRFVLADTIATGIVGALGLSGSVGKIAPACDAQTLLPWPPQVIIMDAATYPSRIVHARRYLLYYLTSDDDGMMEMTDRHGLQLLYALAEWNTALCKGRHHGH